MAGKSAWLPGGPVATRRRGLLRPLRLRGAGRRARPTHRGRRRPKRPGGPGTGQYQCLFVQVARS